MHVSNLKFAVELLHRFSAGQSAITPFCSWVGDTSLKISQSLESAGIIGHDGHLADGIQPAEAVTAVLLLVALRNRVTTF